MQLSSSCVKGIADMVDLEDGGGVELAFFIENIDLDNVDSRLLAAVVGREIIPRRLDSVFPFAYIHSARGNAEVARFGV